MIFKQLVPSLNIKAHSERVNSVCFSNNSKFLASSSKDKTIKV